MMSDVTIKDLSVRDLHYLRAAEGWLELRDTMSANNELEEITAGARAHPIVLLKRYEIYSRAERWNMAAEVAEALTGMLPGEPSSWINLAYATRRKEGGGVHEAKRILLVAAVKFPKDYLIPFKLACCFSQMREFEAAAEWFKKAMAIDKETVQKLAVEDPELKPLWGSMSGTIWKKE